MFLPMPRDMAMSVRLPIVATVAAFAAGAVHAAAPPALPFEDLSWAARVGTQPAASLTMGVLHVSFERTPLGDVAAALGGVIEQQGDAGNSVRWLCYRLDGRRKPQHIWLQSSGEMGGSQHLITAITAITATVAKSGPVRAPDRDCPPIPVSYLPVSFDNGIWLGMQAASLVAKFGAAPGTLGTWSGYRYERKGDGTCRPGGFDVLNSLQWRSAGGVVQALNAGQVSSC